MVEAAEMTRAGFPLEISDPERIPTARYYDADFYRRECEELWPHVWQMACRVEQVPEQNWIYKFAKKHFFSDFGAYENLKED